MRAVRYDDYGDVSALYVAEVPMPTAGPGQVVVRVLATGINPAEAKIRSGIARTLMPSTFPAQQGSELAGTVTQVGAGVSGWAVGDAVFGWDRTRRAHAEFAAVAATDLLARPADLPLEVAGALVSAACSAWPAVKSIPSVPHEVAVVAGAGGAIGSTVLQLLRLRGATVLAVAGSHHHDRLKMLGAIPVVPGAGLIDRLRTSASTAIDTFIDAAGDGFVSVALELGLPANRIHTVIDFAAVSEHGVLGGPNEASAEVIGQAATMVVDGSLQLRIAATFPLDEVRSAFELLASGHPGGKIVLLP